MRRAVILAALAALIGCDDGGGEATSEDAQPVADGAVADVGPDALPPDMGPPLRACETTRGALPDGLETLAWDDDTPVADLSTQAWTILDQPLAESVLHESVRFDLDRPARVYGFSIRYGHLPDDGEAPVAAGLYPDFGYNGFDFWAPDPLWTGTRCRDDADADGWLTFRLPEPVEVAQPGLVYVAHRREGAGSPAWAFDGTPPTPGCEATGDCCAPFTACHSAWNLPELTEYVAGGALNFAFNGLTTTFQYDYLVRLHVEYLEPVPEAPVFRPIEGPAPSNRMAFGDYDGDGDDDLFVNGPRLLRNEGGAFTDVTEDSGLAALEAHGSGVWGDYDNDGCLDVFVFDETDSRPDHLLRGDCAGGFTDVTEAAGIADLQSVVRCEGRDTPHAPTAAAAWLDVDADGFLDLYQGNFICWNEGTFYPDTVWRNEGDGTFTEWTGAHGFRSANQTQLATRGANPIDYDQDGDVDLLVSHYRLQVNLFYRNLGDGTVEPAQLQLNLGGNRARKAGTTYYGHTIGTAWGDLDGDARFDVVVANLAHPRFFDFSDKTQVLLQNPDGTFRDLQGEFAIPMGDAGLRYQETHSVPTLADFDQDGALDLVISAVYDGRPTDFYWGNGDGTFRLDVHSTRIPVTNGWGMATADIDLDGDPDLAAQGAMLENTGGAGHWLQVRAVGGARSNRAGIGASIRVEAGGRTFLRHVNGGTGQGCQDSLVAHVGLGDLDTIDRVAVRFVGAGEVVFEGPFDADQRLWLFEDGSTHAGFAPP